jgi:hypothetical protein
MGNLYWRDSFLASPDLEASRLLLFASLVVSIGQSKRSFRGSGSHLAKPADVAAGTFGP